MLRCRLAFAFALCCGPVVCSEVTRAFVVFTITVACILVVDADLFIAVGLSFDAAAGALGVIVDCDILRPRVFAEFPHCENNLLLAHDCTVAEIMGRVAATYTAKESYRRWDENDIRWLVKLNHGGERAAIIWRFIGKHI